MSKTNKDDAPPPADATPPAAPPETKPPETKAVTGDKLTPLEWAERKGLVGKANPMKPWDPAPMKAEYAAADSLHGWATDAHNYQAEDKKLRITEQDFDAALEAASKYPAVPAHKDACGRGFEDRAKPVVDPRTGVTLDDKGKTVIGEKAKKETK